MLHTEFYFIKFSRANALLCSSSTATINGVVNEPLRASIFTLGRIASRMQIVLEREICIMKKCRITVMKMARYDDLIEKYENPMEHACDLKQGQVFIANGWQKPEGLCDSAWETMSAFVLALSHGGEDFYDGWMKNRKSAMISCNDGFRPVSFYIEALDENATT